MDANASNIEKFGMCGYKNAKNESYKHKLEWAKARFEEGMQCKMLYSKTDGAVGTVEYMPGEHAWRPVDANGYMFIQCIFIIPKKFKEKGYGEMLLKACVNDAKEKGMKGVAVVTRKGSWMAKKDLFLKLGFETVDKAKPDFELLALKFNKSDKEPKFMDNVGEIPSQYGEGLVLFYSYQCPYTHKAITEISEVAKKEFGLEPKAVEFKTSAEARTSPGAFGTFCIAYNGKLVAEHPISKTRFKNIMNKLKDQE